MSARWLPEISAGYRSIKRTGGQPVLKKEKMYMKKHYALYGSQYRGQL